MSIEGIWLFIIGDALDYLFRIIRAVGKAWTLKVSS